ncbi:19343_t:CDS:2, partial [Funneliformis geosporum]
LLEINGNRRKVRIISDELSRELQRIIGEGSKPNFIDISKDNLRHKVRNENGVLVFPGDTICTQRPTNSMSDHLLAVGKYHEKVRETESARTRAIRQIEETIRKGNIDSTTLANAGGFLGESYVGARPSDCLHCSDPEEMVPERSDRINDFKDNQIALLQKIINKFNDYKNSVIKEIIKSAKTQEINDYQTNQLEEDIKNLVSANNQANEEERKKKEQE